MESKERRSSAAPILLALGVFVALLPLLYVAATGPIIWLSERGWVDVEDGSIAANVYSPLFDLAEQNKIFEDSLAQYMQLWARPEPPPPGLHGY